MTTVRKARGGHLVAAVGPRQAPHGQSFLAGFVFPEFCFAMRRVLY
jgi:hypothetical protein